MNFDHNQGKVKYILPVLVFLIPTLVMAFSAYFYLEMNLYRLRLILVETSIFSILLLICILLLPFGKYRKFIYYAAYILIFISVFVQLSYFQLYADQIGASTIFIILETNFTESKEFLSAYFNIFNLLLLILLLLPLLAIKYIPTQYNSGKLDKIILLGLFAGLLLIYYSKALAGQNLYNVAWNSYEQYNMQMNLYEKYGLQESFGNFDEVTPHDSSDEQTFVLVIGESTTRHRMGLYGYPRQTNPLLTSLKNELKVYKDVISPHTHTIQSLSKIMTLNNYENNERINEGTIIQLMNQAGFKTFWISNQKPIGWHESLISVMAKASDFAYFHNPKAEFKPTFFDGDLLPFFQNALDDKAEKKFIVLHLLGTHLEYHNRYPEELKRFHGKSPLAVSNKAGDHHLINQYNNAVGYNDRVIFDFIKALKNMNENSWLLYFSDHGEDVFQVNDFFGHTETKGTYPMYDVPFVLWQSEKFVEKNTLYFDVDRPYMLDDLIYSISDLAGVSFKGFEKERSIFNHSFKIRKREIFNGKNYDSIFKQ